MGTFTETHEKVGVGWIKIKKMDEDGTIEDADKKKTEFFSLEFGGMNFLVFHNKKKPEGKENQPDIRVCMHNPEGKLEEVAIGYSRGDKPGFRFTFDEKKHLMLPNLKKKKTDPENIPDYNIWRKK